MRFTAVAGPLLACVPFANDSLPLMESPYTTVLSLADEAPLNETNTGSSCDKRSRFSTKSMKRWSSSDGLPEKRISFFIHLYLCILHVSMVRTLHKLCPLW